MMCDECGKKEATHKQGTLCINCYMKEWRKNNLEKSRNTSKKYRLKNRDECIARTRKWKEKNPERYKIGKNNNTEEHRKKAREYYRRKHPDAKRRVL